jgi:beta-lactamase regulating signal transducer with metallopeptidase domain
MKAEILKVCEDIVAAGANGVYQGIILALLVGLGLRACRRTNASTRHGVWFATLLLLVLLIPAHLVVAYLAPIIHDGEKASAPPQASVAAADSQTGKEAESPEFGEEHHWAGLPPEPAEFPGHQSFEIQSDGASQTGSEAVISEGTHNSTYLSQGFATDSPGANSIDARRGDKPTHNPGLWRGARFLKPLAWTVTTGASLSGRLSFSLLAVFVCIGVARIALLGWRLLQLRRLKITALPASGELRELFQRLRQRTRTSRAVDLRVSRTQQSPVLLGFVHPVILLPESAVATAPEELEHILRHELAHLARRDDWANLAQHAVQAAFFFHPAVYWISRKLSLEREIACDDYVLEQGSRPRTYALILANLAGHIRGASPLPAPGVSTSKSQLQERITMILNTRRNASPRLAKTRLGIITSAAVMAACIALYTAPRIVFAQSAAVAGGAALAGPPANSSAEIPVALPEPPLMPAPVAVAASGLADQALPGVDRGPKAKAGRDCDDALPVSAAPVPTPFIPSVQPVPGQPAVAAAPVPPALPTPPVAVNVAPLPPVIAVTPRVAVTPRPAYVGVFAQASSDVSSKNLKGPPALKPGATFEERLERLERMVEALVEKQNAQRGPPQAFGGKWVQPGMPGKPWDGQTLEESVKRQAERAAEQANRAADQMKRAAEASERAAKQDGTAAQEQKQKAEAMRKEAYKQQVEAVRKARESLQRELERLDRELERLERNRERLDGQQGSIDLEEQQSEEEELTTGETALINLRRP